MTDSPDQVPEFNTPVEINPVDTHQNWLMRQLQEWEMKTESHIKYDTMAKDNYKYFTEASLNLISATLAADTADYSDNNPNTVPGTHLMVNGAIMILSAVADSISHLKENLKR